MSDAQGLVIDLHEVEGLGKRFDAMQLSPARRRTLLDSLGVEIEAQTHERFDSQTDPEGKKWEPWAESTKEYLQRKFPAASLLQRTGLMKQSITHEVQDSTIVIAGQSMEYATYHHTGTRDKSGRIRMSARQSLGLSDENVADLDVIISEYLEKVMK